MKIERSNWGESFPAEITIHQSDFEITLRQNSDDIEIQCEPKGYYSQISSTYISKALLLSLIEELNKDFAK